VVFGESPLPANRGTDGDAVELSQCPELPPGLGVEDPLAADDDGLLGLAEEAEGLDDLVLLSDGPVAWVTGEVPLGVELGLATSPSRTSIGRRTWTGPGLPAVASLKALRVMLGTSEGLVTVMVSLVTPL
jgi:hypothetical protein